MKPCRTERVPVMVFAGEFWSGASGAGLADGFRRLGWAVQEVDYGRYGAFAAKDVVLRLASRSRRAVTDRAYQQKLVETCQQLKPDIFLTIKGLAITGEMLRRIKETGARTVMYYPDCMFNHPGVVLDSFGDYDLFVTTKTFQVTHLEKALGVDRIAHVPHGFSDVVHRPLYSRVVETAYRADVLYIGNQSPYKQRWLEELTYLAPDLELHLAGNRWRESVRGGPLARRTIAGECVGSLYAEAIQMARINVAIHFGPSELGWDDKVSTRTFEIPACKGFMLHIDNEEVRGFFEPGKEIDVFSSPEELRDKIAFYLKRPVLRAEMIERAYRRCVPAYGYAQRAKEIAALLLRIEERAD